ncbi:MAG: type I glutamate--ammonia ligase [Candidatus Neomarinimicrobiota bacterium]
MATADKIEEIDNGGLPKVQEAPLTPDGIIRRVAEENIANIDYRFIDIQGTWHHFSTPVSQLNETVFTDGVGFDGSSIRTWKEIHESDMLVVPDPGTARLDPFFKDKTLVMICDIVDTVTREVYHRDPRTVAKKCIDYLRSTGIGDQAYLGPEAEFFVFDELRFSNPADGSGAVYAINSREAHWNSGEESEMGNLAFKIRAKGGYFPTPPADTLQDYRSEVASVLESMGIEVEALHHEVASAGQCEIDMRFESLVDMADNLQWFKYVVKNIARAYGKTATFMPKPVFNDNGSGMHTHVSIWKDETNLFSGDAYAGLSDLALHFVGGLVKHARALIALTNPTTNSYKRLVPGFEAPVNMAYSARNRSAAIRIPTYSNNPRTRRIEFRTPDNSCNAYLAFSAMVMAGLDGIQNKLDPGEPFDQDIFFTSARDLESIVTAPMSLDDALNALEADHEWLLHGEVFTADLITTFIDFKRREEVDNMRQRPHPFEFELYHDC